MVLTNKKNSSVQREKSLEMHHKDPSVYHCMSWFMVFPPPAPGNSKKKKKTAEQMSEVNAT